MHGDLLGGREGRADRRTSCLLPSGVLHARFVSRRDGRRRRRRGFGNLGVFLRLIRLKRTLFDGASRGLA
jgi:hypothetical protein